MAKTSSTNLLTNRITILLAIIVAICITVVFLFINLSNTTTKAATHPTFDKIYPDMETGKPIPSDNLHKLQIGMSMKQVEQLLGKPTKDIGSGRIRHLYLVEPEGEITLGYIERDGPTLTYISGTYKDATGKDVSLNEYEQRNTQTP